MKKTYRDLQRFLTFDERFEYLKLGGMVGASTFGFDRYLNQRFYTSLEWKRARDAVITRDNGCDLGVDGYEIHDKILVHHMNPITQDDLILANDVVLDLDNLITTTHNTHNAIHFGDSSLIKKLPPERRPGDTKLW